MSFRKILKILYECVLKTKPHVELSSYKDTEIKISSSTLAVLYIRRMLRHLFGFILGKRENWLSKRDDFRKIKTP